MKRRVLFGTIISVILSFYVQAVNFSRINVAWQYNPSFDVKMAHRVFKDANGLHVFLSINSDSLASWTYELLIQRNYESETHELLKPLGIDTLLVTDNSTIIRLDLSERDESLMVLKFFKIDRHYYYDINLKVGSLSFPSIYPIDESGLPILKNFINRSGFSWEGSDSFLAMKYAEAFQPADPPMADMKPLAPQVDMDTSFIFNDSILFEENSFYTIRKDSLATVGVTMLRVPPYFPKYRQLGELVESMLYLTSEQEKKSMLKSRNLRESFDSFWMNTYSTKSRARNAIRAYYNKVEVVNELFTNFKAGWKTDRGMIYIIFGLPDEVYRTTNSEEWYYDTGEAFEFTVISTFFASRTYSLRRKKELEERWYTQIATLRRSMNE